MSNIYVLSVCVHGKFCIFYAKREFLYRLSSFFTLDFFSLFVSFYLYLLSPFLPRSLFPFSRLPPTHPLSPSLPPTHLLFLSLSCILRKIRERQTAIRQLYVSSKKLIASYYARIKRVSDRMPDEMRSLFSSLFFTNRRRGRFRRLAVSSLSLFLFPPYLGNMQRARLQP